MPEASLDPAVLRFARRTRTMSASEVRALFAVASRPEVVSLAGGMPYVQALPMGDVVEAARRALEERGASALQYGAGIGHPGLRERLCSLMAEQGISASEDDVVIVDGAQQGLDLVAKVLVDEGDPIVVEEPTYVGAISAFGAYEPAFVQVPLDDDGLQVDRLEQELEAGLRPKFVYVVPNFHNPAGVTMSPERRERLVEVCRRFAVPIVEDDPYGMLRFEGTSLPSLRSLDPGHVIYLGTLSKIFAPGIRLGWVLADPSMVERVVLAKEAANLCSSSFTQFVAEEYLHGERWRANLTGLVDVYRGRRDAMLAALEREMPPGVEWTHPSGGFYVWVKVPPSLDLTALLPEAVERRVAYVPGTAFYPDGRGRDHMRLSFCYPTEERIVEGVARLGTLLRERLTQVV
jgi:DNA-binding transcriptional MocR family regulator